MTTLDDPGPKDPKGPRLYCRKCGNATEEEGCFCPFCGEPFPDTGVDKAPPPKERNSDPWTTIVDPGPPAALFDADSGAAHPSANNETLIDIHPPLHMVEGEPAPPALDGGPARDDEPSPLPPPRRTLTPDSEPVTVYREPPPARSRGAWRVAAIIACLTWTLLPAVAILGAVGVEPVAGVVASLPVFLLLFAIPALVTVLALLLRSQSRPLD